MRTVAPSLDGGHGRITNTGVINKNSFNDCECYHMPVQYDVLQWRVQLSIKIEQLV